MSATGGTAPTVAGAPTVRPPVPGVPSPGVATPTGPPPAPAPPDRVPAPTCPPPATHASGATDPDRPDGGATVPDGPETRDGAVTEAALTDLRRHVVGLVAELPGPLRRLRVCAGGAELEVEWRHEAGSNPLAPVPAPRTASAAPAAPLASSAPTGPPEPVGAAAPVSRSAVRSPMVGTFYRAPEPGTAPFVAVGDLVRPGQVVGIVEAMKLMNEITADRAGRVTEVLVADGQPVEYDQPLVALDPA
ncbi:acetyl-CoA carboxylase biotin carboxyl carrier protein [Verrucosispora sp. NA02020]|uniref:acetyl-CoA carboxylase biotin carboxyl carrier protein n=1 Tax=Verrucosispora sp. NA02020 TaxID=2742132 RepID=UPI0020CA75C7|nr:acetyl-CoA carboxylase biotin carboxyl carrier protein [Verrucosispora sp. NA02020]